jgi:hypothetical protein
MNKCDLMKETPVGDVCEAFKVARGMVQGLQENAGRFASMVAVFCERLGWHDFEGLVAKFQNRVSFGVRAEVVELTTIPYVKVSSRSSMSVLHSSNNLCFVVVLLLLVLKYSLCSPVSSIQFAGLSSKSTL